MRDYHARGERACVMDKEFHLCAEGPKVVVDLALIIVYMIMCIEHVRLFVAFRACLGLIAVMACQGCFDAFSQSEF